MTLIIFIFLVSALCAAFWLRRRENAARAAQTNSKDMNTLPNEDVSQDDVSQIMENITAIEQYTLNNRSALPAGVGRKLVYSFTLRDIHIQAFNAYLQLDNPPALSPWMEMVKQEALTRETTKHWQYWNKDRQEGDYPLFIEFDDTEAHALPEALTSADALPDIQLTGLVYKMAEEGSELTLFINEEFCQEVDSWCSPENDEMVDNMRKYIAQHGATEVQVRIVNRDLSGAYLVQDTTGEVCWAYQNENAVAYLVHHEAFGEFDGRGVYLQPWFFSNAREEVDVALVLEGQNMGNVRIVGD
jgi:hypothetical protein